MGRRAAGVLVGLAMVAWAAAAAAVPARVVAFEAKVFAGKSLMSPILHTFVVADDCSPSATTCTGINIPLLAIGAGVGCAGPLIGLAIRPTRNDLLDVINRWNVRHPDEPFELTR